MSKSAVLINRYELKKRIGFGGMGAVYTAHDRIMDRPVAVKELRHEYSGDELLRRRFIREAQAAGGLSSPHIVTVHDLIEQDKTLFIVMEFLDGGTLLDRMNAAPERRMNVEETLEIGRQSLLGLVAAHNAGLVHRDIKPGNLLFDSKGLVKIADFGVVTARNSDHTATALTQAGTHPGTLVYMAPEQIDGAEVEGRSDVYSMAAVLYECLAGIRYFERPGVRRSERALMDAICDLPPISLRLHVPYVPESVERILEQALAKDVIERPSAQQLAGELERILRAPKAKPQIVAPGTGRIARGNVDVTEPGSGPSASELAETRPSGTGHVHDLVRDRREEATQPRPHTEALSSAPRPTTPLLELPTGPQGIAPTTPSRRRPSGRPVIEDPTRIAPARTRDAAPMVLVPGGSFVCGSDESSDEMPPRRVTVAEFALDRDPVTLGQYRRFLQEAAHAPTPDVPLLRQLYPNGKDHRPQGWGTRAFSDVCPTDAHPVVLVDWFDAMAYAAWAGARLPTEAEWERAARGLHDGRRRPWGDDPPTPATANFGRTTQGPTPIGAHPAGASQEGVQDLVGNVWEWCLDRYHPGAYAFLPTSDPVLEVSDAQAKAVKRGGSWTNAPVSIRCSKRGAEKLHVRRSNLGFRCARSSAP